MLFRSGDVDQRRRLRILQEFKDGTLPILVATDVASRGLHIEGVTHVINYDLPFDAEDYVHRVGRTARAGASGKAISLACEDYVQGLEPIEAYIGFKLPHDFPDDAMLAEHVVHPPRRHREDVRHGRSDRHEPRHGRSHGAHESRSTHGHGSKSSHGAHAPHGAHTSHGAHESHGGHAAHGAHASHGAHAATPAHAAGGGDATKRRRRRRRRKPGGGAGATPPTQA